MDPMQIIYFALTILALVVLFGGMHVRMLALERAIYMMERERLDRVLRPPVDYAEGDDHD